MGVVVVGITTGDEFACIIHFGNLRVLSSFISIDSDLSSLVVTDSVLSSFVVTDSALSSFVSIDSALSS